ncbi:unnamed protein product [Prorocentrum cordatum]|uniref:Glycerophosphocholine acyltransferase 1 n=1 Tax=Prorocentrum cordatum TaxID=2364126 RepID=A0ABN9XAA1_9DINO|nr:unnamed protein product [Polarella glacialis]CAK0894778.1 unnamed protein product [Polarella glacialis]
MRGPRRRIGSMARKLREGPKKVVGTMRERQQVLQQEYQRQVLELKGRLDQGLSRARSSRARQLRHMVCFVCSMADVVVTSIWLGASPWTLHWYYTIKLSGLIVGRAVWYRWHGWHYFLYDLCYFSNLVLLVYIWVLPNSEVLFEAAYGLSGVLMVSIPVFRNSFVPHSLDRITSLHIHLGPALQLYVLRWYSNGRPVWWSETCPSGGLPAEEVRSWFGLAGAPCVFRIPDAYSVLPSLCVYAVFIVGYCVNQFFWNRKTIDRRGYATLYHHMAYDMGIINRLPTRLRGPCASRCVFVVGHFLLFCAGLPVVHAPCLLHTALLCVVTAWALWNGASFYITYFWRVYEEQIHAFERQMAEAASKSAHPDVQEAPLTPRGGRCTDTSTEPPKTSEDPTSPTDADDEGTDAGPQPDGPDKTA